MQYKVGIYGGCFDPIHLGHVDCILQAANRCEELYVILSVSTKVKQIDERVRYRWLYQLTQHLEHVKILRLEDHSADKAAYTHEVAMADCAYVRSTIGKPIDVVFCGSDYGEDSFWRVGYPESTLVSIPRNEMSSTELRKNPYAHWDWIPTVARPYFVKKVLLIGGESVGKSTLTIHLAHRFNTNYIDEAGRAISLRSGDDRLMLQQDYTEILLHQKLNEIEATKHSNKVLFVDTDALITRFYLEFLDAETSEKNVALAEAIDAINAYDLILFLEPDVKFVQDGSRSEEIYRDREKYSRQIKAILQAHNRNFVSVSGDYQERYEQAVACVNALFE